MRSRALLAVFVLATSCHCNEYGFVAARKTGDLSAGEPPRLRFDTRGIAACGPGEVTEAGRAAVRRYPYLQQVGATAARILWTAVPAQPAQVRVWRADSETRDDAITRVGAVDATAPLEGARQFEARLDDLEPYALYCYEIAAGDQMWIGATSFRTAPAPAASTPVRFAAMGDIGKAVPEQFAVRDQLESVEMDLLLIAGDVAYDEGELEEFERHVFAVYRDLFRRVPLFPASGNHDYKTDDARPFRQVFSLPDNGGEAGRERWYSFDWGMIHFLVLDTEKIGDEQIRWAERDLASSTARWKVVLAHRPAFSAGTHGDEEDVQEAFLPLFARYGVDLVLSGHDHHYERSRPVDGVVYVVTGGGGRGTRRVGRGDTTAFAERVAHFVYVTAGAEELTLHAIDARGKVFDGLRLRARTGKSGGDR